MDRFKKGQGNVHQLSAFHAVKYITQMLCQVKMHDMSRDALGNAAAWFMPAIGATPTPVLVTGLYMKNHAQRLFT
jgi:hypothetical protein